MKTYLAYDNNYYKIGRSNNPEKRVEDLKTANPAIRLLCYGEGDKEMFLHKRYDSCRVAREWFDLSEEQVREIKETIGENLNRFTEFKKVIDFGKYRGLQLAELTSNYHKDYMRWYVENNNIYTNNWARLFKLQLDRLEKLSKIFKNKKR